MSGTKENTVQQIVTYLTRHKHPDDQVTKDELAARLKRETISRAEEAQSCKDLRNALFNDAIHGPVQLNSLLVKIVNTPEFQRLRLIKQLGGGCYVYPGANHKRFDHSIGVCHIAGEFGRFLKSQLEEAKYRKKWPHEELTITGNEILCLQIAGLCHDLGHGPLSHTFELRVSNRVLDSSSIELSKHEELSIMVFERIMKNPDVLVEFVYVYGLGLPEIHLIKDMIHPDRNREESETCLAGREEKRFLLEIIANKESGIDVDKWDYFTRDCHYLGIAMDFQWKRCMLLGRICKFDDKQHGTKTTFRLCFHIKELDNIYGMGRTRSTLHRKACVHKTKVAVEEMFAKAMREVCDVPLIPIWNPDRLITSEDGTSLHSDAGSDNTIQQLSLSDPGDGIVQQSEATGGSDSIPTATVPIQREEIKTLRQAIELAAKDGDLRWFLSLNDLSIITLIKNWSYYADPQSHKKFKKSIEEAEKLLNRIDHRQLYHRIAVERVQRHQDPDLSKMPAANEAGQKMVEWNITRLMTKFDKPEDKEMEVKRKQALKDLGGKIFADDATNALIDIVSISFGSETKDDPVQDVLFYTTENPFTAIDWKSIQDELGVKPSSLALPLHFTEYEIRIYNTSNSGDSAAIRNKLETHFKSWKETVLSKKALF